MDNVNNIFEMGNEQLNVENKTRMNKNAYLLGGLFVLPNQCIAPLFLTQTGHKPGVVFYLFVTSLNFEFSTNPLGI